MDHTAAEVLNDSALVTAARQGDAAAWEALVRQHQESIFRLAYLILGDSSDAEDTGQETFLRAYRALDRFDSERPLRPWLLSIAANLARNRRRSLGRYLAATQRLFRSEGVSEQLHTAPVEERASQRWTSHALWQAVRRLSSTDQTIIYLRYFLDMPTREVALTLDIAEGTVKSRLARAIERLRGVIARDFPDLNEGMDEE